LKTRKLECWPGGANQGRLDSVTYPNNTRKLNYNYASGLNDNISRLSSLSDNSPTSPTIFESYDYLGLGTVVRRGHLESGVDLTYISQTGGTGDAGDKYTGLDRFGRVVDQLWIRSSTATDDFQYGYDRDSNRLYRNNVVNPAFGELYHANGASSGYDNLNQLTAFSRGTLSASISGGTLDTITTPSRSQGWTLDVMGNFTSQTTGTTSVTRAHNMQNEVTAVGQAALTFDANGNLTTDETGRTLVYDAWNRLVQVKDTSSATLANYAYDALNRRITELGPDLAYDLFGLTHHFYYSANWQVLEERVMAVTHAQYVWSPVYVDALVLRDRDPSNAGALTEHLYVQQDANFNVTALVNTSGTVVERYVYDPYGTPTVYDGNWSALAGSAFAWLYLHQGGRYELQTGLYDFRNREYSPTLGRFVQRDPIGFAAGDTNLYRYVGNGPVNSVDPSGLSEIVLDWLPDGRAAVYYVPEFLGFNLDSSRQYLGVYDPVTGYVSNGPRRLPLSQVQSIGHRWFGGTPNWRQIFVDNAIDDAQDRQRAGLAWRAEVGHLGQFRNDVFQLRDALEDLGHEVVAAVVLPFAPRINIRGLNHAFDSHAAQWFGRAVNRRCDFAVFEQLVRRVARARRWFEWSSGGTPTYATLARINGEWIVVQITQATGELLTVFRPNPSQLRAMLRVIRGL
jgi:RHS repeat-associated protein